jgi:hypothetical protein
MKRKAFLKLKPGLLDPKHIKKIGDVRIWLYLYILLLGDGDGIISGWTDAQVGKDLGREARTIKDQRQKLQREGYIVCEQDGQHALKVRITKWLNPWKPWVQGDNPAGPLNPQGDNMTTSGGQLPPLKNTSLPSVDLSNRLSTVACEETHAPPPDSPIEKLKRQKPVRLPSPVQPLEDFFCSETGIPPMVCKSKRDWAEHGELWVRPLKAVLDACGSSEAKAHKAVRLAIAAMRKDRLTLATPKSIQKTAISLVAELKKSPAGQEQDFLERLRRGQ